MTIFYISTCLFLFYSVCIKKNSNHFHTFYSVRSFKMCFSVILMPFERLLCVTIKCPIRRIRIRFYWFFENVNQFIIVNVIIIEESFFFHSWWILPEKGTNKQTGYLITPAKVKKNLILLPQNISYVRRGSVWYRTWTSAVWPQRTQCSRGSLGGHWAVRSGTHLAEPSSTRGTGASCQLQNSASPVSPTQTCNHISGWSVWLQDCH